MPGPGRPPTIPPRPLGAGAPRPAAGVAPRAPIAPRVPTGMSPRPPTASLTNDTKGLTPPGGFTHDSVTAVTAVTPTAFDEGAVERAKKELDDLVRPLRERVAELTGEIAVLRRRVADAEAALERARDDARRVAERAQAASSLIPVSIPPSVAPATPTDLTPFVPMVTPHPPLPADLTPILPIPAPKAGPPPMPGSAQTTVTLPSTPPPMVTPRQVDATLVRNAASFGPEPTPTIGFASVAPPVYRERTPSLVEIAARAPVRADDADLGAMIALQKSRQLRSKLLLVVIVLAVVGLGAATILSRA